MAKVTFDSNIFIKNKPAKLPAGFYMSMIVLQELLAGANDAAAIKELKAAYQNYEKANRPKMSTADKYRITNDVLIARTARRAGVAIVTDNVKDFERIRNFCNVRLISGADFFGH